MSEKGWRRTYRIIADYCDGEYTIRNPTEEDRERTRVRRAIEDRRDMQRLKREHDDRQDI